MDSPCIYGCDGSGTMTVHAAECMQDICTLTGGINDCRGDIVDCACTAHQDEAGKGDALVLAADRALREWAEQRFKRSQLE